MALVEGYLRGEPALIPENFVRLFPDYYSLTPPQQAEASVEVADAPKRERARKD